MLIVNTLKLKFAPDWFVTSEMIQKLYVSFVDDDILFLDKGSGNATFSRGEMGILDVDLNNINLDDANIYENDPKTIIHACLLFWYYSYKQRKGLKK